MSVRILIGDCRERLRELPEKSVHMCVTSPPYFGLRSYLPEGHADKAKEIGLEQTPAEFVAELVEVFREVRRVLRDDGTCWVNLGDSYATAIKGGGGKNTSALVASARGKVTAGGAKRSQERQSMPPRRFRHDVKEKDLLGIPWRVAFALQDDGWHLRQDLIWHKPNPMPESVTDRCTKAHEYLFMLSKSPRYYFDADAIQEAAAYPGGAGNRRGYRVPGERPSDNANLGGGLHKIGPRETRNKRSVWTVGSEPFKEAHFATFPPSLIKPCILAGCPVGGTVLDPFGGAGTTGMVADRLRRNAILVELDTRSVEIARKRLEGDAGMFSDVEAA